MLLYLVFFVACWVGFDLSCFPIVICHILDDYECGHSRLVSMHLFLRNVCLFSIGSCFILFLVSVVECVIPMIRCQIPKNLVSWELIILSSNLICSLILLPFGWNNMNTVLSTFKVTLLALNQSLMISRSCSRQHSTNFLFLCPKYRVVSSANCIHSKNSRFTYKSLQKILKSKGQRHDSWGVPYSTSYQSEYSVPLVSLHFDLNFLLVR